MDESGFAIGTSQSTRVLVIVNLDKSRFKRVFGRQEWITTVECIRETE